MSDAVQIALITGCASIIPSCIGLYNGWHQRKMAADIARVQKQTNSIVTQLVASTAKASEGEGKEKGIAQERANPQSPVGT